MMLRRTLGVFAPEPLPPATFASIDFDAPVPGPLAVALAAADEGLLLRSIGVLILPLAAGEGVVGDGVAGISSPGVDDKVCDDGLLKQGTSSTAFPFPFPLPSGFDIPVLEVALVAVRRGVGGEVAAVLAREALPLAGVACDFLLPVVVEDWVDAFCDLRMGAFFS